MLDNISSIGTNAVNVYQARHLATEIPLASSPSAKRRRCAGQPAVRRQLPKLSANAAIRLGNVSATAQVSGVGADYFQVNGRNILSGLAFDANAVADRSQVAVIDQTR